MENVINRIDGFIAEAIQGVVSKGLAEPIIIRESDDNVIPAIISPDGESLSVCYDDEDAVSTYHRLLKKDYVINRKEGEGDNPRRYAVYDMALYATGKREVISALECERVLVKAIHDAASKLEYTEVKMSSFDRAQIFSSEYQGVQFPLQPNIFLLKINYKLTRAESPCAKL